MLRRTRMHASHVLRELLHSGRNGARVFLRHLKLQVVPQLTKWNKDAEDSKVVLHKHHGFAILHAIPHLIPLTACVALIVLNFESYFVGDIATSAATAFQFAAKVLELTIQASLATILLSIIRREAIAKVLPFGAIFAPLRSADVSYLWSLEYWGLATSMRTKRGRKATLAVLIPVFVALGTVVGPSSAVLMLPRLVMHSGDQYLVVLDSNSTLFPQVVQSLNTTTIELTVPSVLLQTTVSGSFAVADNVNIRHFDAYVSESSESDTVANTVTISTLPGRQSVYGVSLPTTHYHNNYVELPWSVLETGTYQPIVQAYCRRWLTYDINSTDYVTFSVGMPQLNRLITIAEVFANVSNNAVAVFVDMPTSSVAKHSTLLATGQIIPDSGDVNPSSILACTIDAMWARSRLNQTALEEIGFTLSRPATDAIPASELIHIPAAVANKHIAPLITSMALELTPDRAIALALADGCPVDLDQNTFAWDWLDITAYRPRTALTDEQFWKMQHYIDDNALHGKYANIFVATTTGWNDPATLTHQVSQSYSQGYGYNREGVTVQLSVAVLGLYCVMIVIFLTWSLLTGLTGSRWDSASEFFTLGLNSKKPTHLGCTSAGIDTLSTFRQLVSVRVNDEESLELIFQDDPGTRTRKYTKVELNRAY